jgi:protein phosphatase
VGKLHAVSGLKEEEHIEISFTDVMTICELAIKVLKKDSSSALLELGTSADDNEQWAIFGDLHGQYNDMVQLLSCFTQDWTKQQKCEGLVMKYLFLGDYVDRGSHSFDVMLSLLCWKCLAPDQMYMLRGNHEIMTVNGRYGFRNECVKIYGEMGGRAIWTKFNHVFNWLPLAATVNNEYFCVHGGLTEQLDNISQIAALTLPIEIQEGTQTMENNILWSDPNRPNPDSKFTFNPKRGPKFGNEAVDDFFTSNKGLKRIVRAHQVAARGYWKALDDRVLTIFSAPDYKGESKNLGGVLIIRKNEVDCVLQCHKTSNGELVSVRIVRV